MIPVPLPARSSQERSTRKERDQKQHDADQPDQELREVKPSQELSGLPVVSFELRVARDLLREKDTVPVAIVELQSEMKKRWMRFDSPEQLVRTRVSPERAAALLTEPFVLYHEASLSEIDALASLLKIDIFSARRAASGGTQVWSNVKSA